jgi:hypothetical protein
MSFVLERLVRQFRLAAVILGTLVPTVELAAQQFSKKLAVESSKSGASLGSAAITIQKIKRTTAVKLTAPTEISANAFFLDSPARLVVDVSGCKTRRSEKFSVPSDPQVSGIRVGAHSDKLRMVVDLTSATKPDFKVTVGSRQVTLTISDGASSEQNSDRKEPPMRAEPTTVPTSVPSASPEILPIQIELPQTAVTSVPATTIATIAEPEVVSTTPVIAPSVSPTASPSATSTALPSPKPTLKPVVTENRPSSAEPTPKPPAPTPIPRAAAAAPLRGGIAYLLTGYRFEYLEPGRVPILKILLNKPRANAQISKVGPKAYKIVVPSCTIAGKGLDLPQFPPADFLGFVMIAAKAVDDKTEITVSVEQGVTLGTFVRQNEIWVKRL